MSEQVKRDCEHGRQLGKCVDCDYAALESDYATLQSDYLDLHSMFTDLQAECNALWSTYVALVDKLGIDTAKARKADGKPSDVFVSHIDALQAECERLLAELSGETERAKLLLNSKNHWADRARRAEQELASRPTTEAYDAACKALWKHRDELAAIKAQEPVVTLLCGDPHDEREGYWISVEDKERLASLPAGTKLYILP